MATATHKNPGKSGGDSRSSRSEYQALTDSYGFRNDSIHSHKASEFRVVFI